MRKNMIVRVMTKFPQSRNSTKGELVEAGCREQCGSGKRETTYNIAVRVPYLEE